jgi:integrase
MRVKFYLNRKSLFCRITPLMGDPLEYYLNEVVQRSYWNSKTQRVKANAPREVARINDIMDSLVQYLNDLGFSAKMNGTVIRANELEVLLDQRYRGKVDGSKPVMGGFKEYAYDFLERKKDTSSVRQLKSYTKNWFLMFPDFDWDDVSSVWVKKAHITMAKKYKSTTCHKYFSIMRTIIKEGIEDNVWTGALPRAWMPKYVQPDDIYLEMGVCEQMYKYDGFPHLNNAAKLWLLMLYTGCRYVNLKEVLSPMNVIYHMGEPLLRYKQAKSKKYVSLPLTGKLQDLLDSKPNLISNQKLNKYIKTVLCEIGFDKYDQVTCHTARRSCITNLVLMGSPLHLVMKVSGHSTEKELMRYLKYDDLIGAVAMSEDEGFIEFNRVLVD